MRGYYYAWSTLAASLMLATACGPSTGSTCSSTEDCPENQACLTEFKGGYCGIKDCADDADCPDDALCVKHEGTNYCFLGCQDKTQCNAQRPVEQEANCSSNIERVGASTAKACVPPAGV